MIGIIGGSGFYNFIENMEKETINTPFGSVEVEIGKINDKEIMFLPRHGKTHSIPPHKINFRANIFAAHLKKVEFLITTNAVGSLNQEYKIGDFAMIHDVIDFTRGRISTFFDGSDFEITTNRGNYLSGVVHTDVSECFDLELRNNISDQANKLGMSVHDSGVIVVTNGPRFESPAEINGYAKIGADLVGMTSAPEVFLAKELEIPYASVGVITNNAAGLQTSVSAEEVFQIFSKKIIDIKKLFKSIVANN